MEHQLIASRVIKIKFGIIGLTYLLFVLALL